ncbi:hypothetical protein TNCV_4982511 [Trichonephila clavipes]|nr:hypothetical protein TNCV_4982511 [Trichonephila clavipes]
MLREVNIFNYAYYFWCAQLNHFIVIDIPYYYNHVVVLWLKQFVSRSRNEAHEGARRTPVVGIERHTGDSTNSLFEIPRRDDRWRHHLYTLPQFRLGTEGEGNTLQFLCTRDSAHKTFGPTDLINTYFVCTRRVFGDIRHRAQAFRSEVQCSNH